MPVQWFPGHMAKTKRLINENLKLVDVVIEICDARIPMSSRNPILNDITLNKPRLLVLNKSDMADEIETEKWQGYFKTSGVYSIVCDSMSGLGTEKVSSALREINAEKIKNYEQKGQVRNIKAMVVGIPNVGKSSFINRISGRKKAKVEDRPGVTKDKQWIKIAEGIDLLDTPGILWPKFENEITGYHLAFIGAIKDDVIDIEEIACMLAGFLYREYHDMLTSRYKLKEETYDSDYDILCDIGSARGFLIKGGETDTERTAKMLLDEFRSGKIGRITIEKIK